MPLDAQRQLDEILGDLKADLIKLKVDPGNTNVLSSILSSLNGIFTDAKCKDVIYTKNTDKLFFGIIVMPVFTSPQQVIDIAVNTDNFRITEYKVELDSKLFDNFTGLNIDEILSLLVHEVAALVINDTPARRARYYIDLYLTETNQTIKISDYISYIDLLGFGIKEAIRKCISIFSDTKDYRLDIDDALELTPFLNSAMLKIGNLGDAWDKSVDSAYIVIEWTLRLYKNILTYRIPALHTLKKALDYTASKYERFEIENLITRLNRIDDDSLIHESSALLSYVQESYKNVSHFFSDCDMVKAEAKACTSVGELDDVFHSINANMSHIEHYLETHTVDEQTEAKLTAVYEEYDGIRTRLKPELQKLHT